jgi:glycosyltransferase involved in cell wall biosynthesis
MTMVNAPTVSGAREGTAVAQAARPRRILYVEQNVDGTTGGSYRSLLFLLRGLDRTAFTPIVAFYREHELLGDYQGAGCRTMLLWYPKPFNFTGGVRRLGALGRLLLPIAALLQKAVNVAWVSGALFVRNLRLLLRERVDVLHLNNGVTVGAEFLVAARLLGLKTVIHQRGITPVPRWCSWLSRKADHVICVSDAARDNLIENGLLPERCTAIHNGINMEALRRQIKRSPQEVRAAIGIEPGRRIVGLAGMIRPWKGQMVLVKAMEILKDRHPEALALIMGGVSDHDRRDREYYAEIVAYMKEHHLEGCIRLLDYQPNAPEFLQIFDVMVHTAIDPEPFSRVVIEGMALERAIVGSATGGTPEAIVDGTSGYLVPADDPAALAARVSDLLQHEDRRRAFGIAARERVEERFHIQGHIARTEAVYKGLEGRA